MTPGETKDVLEFVLGAVFVTVMLAAWLTPWIVGRRLKVLMHRVSTDAEATARSAATNADPREERQPGRALNYVEHRFADFTDIEAEWSVRPRAEHAGRWLADFRLAFRYDLAPAAGYLLLPSLGWLVAGDPDKYLGSGVPPALICALIALLRRWLHAAKFTTDDRQFGVQGTKVLGMAVNVARAGAMGGPAGAGLAFALYALYLLTLPRLRALAVVACVALAGFMAFGLADEAPGTVAGLALAALAHAGLAVRLHVVMQRRQGLRLLVLRVFGGTERATYTFERVLAVWTFFGSYLTVLDPGRWHHANPLFSLGALMRVLVASALLFFILERVERVGPTTAREVIIFAILALAGVAAYVAIGWRRLDTICVRNLPQLTRTLERLNAWPRRPDLAFRRLELPCHANTWKMVVAEIAQRASAVLMDLRGIGGSQGGCEHEVNYLLDWIPLERVVFLVEDADLPDAHALLDQAWARVHRQSPNLANDALTATLYVTAASHEADVQGIVTLLLAVTERGTSKESVERARAAPVGGDAAPG